MQLTQTYIRLCLLFLFLIAASSCVSATETSDTKPRSAQITSQPIPIYTYRIINHYPHDRNAFTEGLAYENGFLYEGTGLNGRSSIRKVDLKTGDILQIYQVPDQYFGEGITIYKEALIQLTWKSRTGFVYDQNTFELLSNFSYSTEGWGITHDGKHLIMSDGSSTLYLLNPDTFEPVGNVEVTDNDAPVTNINELEFVNGKIYANVWQSDKIAIIELSNGRVAGWIDLSGLLSYQEYSGKVDVLNGIAYDAKNDRLFVTGKLWPLLFEIKLVTR